MIVPFKYVEYGVYADLIMIGLRVIKGVYRGIMEKTMETIIMASYRGYRGGCMEIMGKNMETTT